MPRPQSNKTFQQTQITVHSGFDLHPGQREVFDCTARYRVLDCGRRWGKALAIDTPIPTPTGWKDMGDLQVGDFVFDENGCPVRITMTTPTMLGHDCYEVEFDNGEIIVADAGHRWLTYSKAARKHLGRVSSGDHRSETTRPSVVTTEHMEETLTVGVKNEANHAIRLSQPVLRADQLLPIHPYVLGAWLGDGASRSAMLTSNDQGIIEAIRATGQHVRKGKDKFAWFLSSGVRSSVERRGSLQARLRQLDLLGNKHIPDIYLKASVDQRIELLMGLMDTDGYVSASGNCFFDNTNKRIVDGVYELLSGLGIKTHYNVRRATLNGRDCGPSYRLGFTTEKPVFKLQRKRERQKAQVKRCQDFYFVRAVRAVPSVPVRCIAVDSSSHLYLASRSYIPTHNSELAKVELAVTAGEGYPVSYMTPTVKMLEETWRGVKTLLGPAITAKNEVQHRIELVTGGSIEFWSLDNPDSPRGRKYKKVVVDEAALIKGLTDVWEAVIWPTLIDYKGVALFPSTPRGHDAFYQLYLRGLDPLQPDWASFKKPTVDNPYIDPKEVEAARRTIPERIYRQEYLADFIDDAGAVFRNIENCTGAKMQEQAIDGHVYFIGVDLAKTNDFSVFVVVDVTEGQVVYLDRANHVEYSLQLDRLVTLSAKFHPIGIIVEKNANLAFMELLEKTALPIIPFQTSNASKMMIIEHLAAAFDRSQIMILDDAVLIGELMTFSMERMGTGLMRYGAPYGSHDDTVMATALAWWGATFNAPTWEATLV